MSKKFLLTGVVLLMGCGLAAHADTIYNLDVQQNGKAGTSEGTVTITQISPTEVSVSATVASGYYFVASGSGNSLDFNLSDASPTINITTTDFTMSGTSVNGSPWGTFDYGIGCSGITCGSGASNTTDATLTFTVTDPGGISYLNFTPNPGKNDTPEIYFVSDINPAGGNVAAGAGSSTVMTPVPEPSSLMLLGSGVLGLAGMVRRRFKG